MSNNINKVNVCYLNKLFQIKSGSNYKIHFERKNTTPIGVIYVSKALPKELRNELKNTQKIKPVKIIVKGIATQKDIIKYKKSIKYVLPEGLNTITLNSDVIKTSCSICCIKGKRSLSFQLKIKNRIAEEIARRKERVGILRKKDGTFVIRKWKNGRPFNLYKYPNGNPVVYIPLPPSLIKENEKRLFKNGRTSLPSKVELSEKEFQLNISKFFQTKEEKELAYSLLEKGIKVRIPEAHKREGDIITQNPYTQIEVTTIKPVEKDFVKNNPHGEGVHLNARICEGFLRVAKGIVPIFFVVFHEDWMKFKWVRNLIELVRPNVICIPTNFDQGWEEWVANEIQLKLKKHVSIW